MSESNESNGFDELNELDTLIGSIQTAVQQISEVLAANGEPGEAITDIQVSELREADSLLWSVVDQLDFSLPDPGETLLASTWQYIHSLHQRRLVVRVLEIEDERFDECLVDLVLAWESAKKTPDRLLERRRLEMPPMIRLPYKRSSAEAYRQAFNEVEEQFNLILLREF